MKTRPIGERFQDVGVTLEVRKDNDVCLECYYKDSDECGLKRLLTGECNKKTRDDSKSAVFVRVEE